MRRAAAIGAGVAAIATSVVVVIALLGVSRLPLAELLLFPGSLAAWMYKGDNYRSSHDFLVHAAAFGVPINIVLGAAVGSLFHALSRLWDRKQS